ncbi:MAG: type II toxin-antitoxin system Phd/YefM family antitoxin [Bacilli bacterium]|nr:type II toxin-antitoxin system Phd/YefM family antitoxin [Bacilli bacterium]
MNKINIKTLEKNFQKYIKEVVKENKSFLITTEQGNLIMLSESEYRGIKETLYLYSQKGLIDSILEGSKEDISLLTEYSELDW